MLAHLAVAHNSETNSIRIGILVAVSITYILGNDSLQATAGFPFPTGCQDRRSHVYV